jgi:hypothetical protein
MTQIDARDFIWLKYMAVAFRYAVDMMPLCKGGWDV